MNKIEIWEPRYSTREVLVAAHKVGLHNLIVFTKAKSLPGEWYVSGQDVKKYPLTDNGKIPVYTVPLTALTPMGERNG